MSVPRAVAVQRGWFPPATFQLRLRSLKSIIYITSPRSNRKDSSLIFVTLHCTENGPIVWQSPKLKCDKDDKLEWTDIEIDKRLVNLGLKSIVVKVWLFSDNENSLLTSWGIYFSGLWSLGIHKPTHGRLPANSLVFQIHGSFFSSASYIRDMTPSNQIPRFLHIGTVEDKTYLKSYDTRLLSRLHMTQRVLKQQDSKNTRLIAALKNLGVDRTRISLQDALLIPRSLEVEDTTSIVNPGALPSLRQTLLVRKSKLPKTRESEQDLLARLELARIRISLLQKERDRQKQAVERLRSEKEALIFQMEEKTISQMNYYHNLSKEKGALQTWMDQFRIDQKNHELWLLRLRQERLSILNSLLTIFPIGDLDGKRPTLRWTTLPPSDEIRESIRDENHVSVVVGEVAQFISVISHILDFPLRHHISLLGSTTFIWEDVKGCLPLHLKSTSNSEWAKFDEALLLMNLDLAQIRWSCGIRDCTDTRATLHNLHEVVTLGKDMDRFCKHSAPTSLTRMMPPATFHSQVVVKNGRVANMLLSSPRKNSYSSDPGGIAAAAPGSDEESEDALQSDQVLSSSTSSSNEVSSGVPETPPKNDPCEEIMEDSIIDQDEAAVFSPVSEEENEVPSGGIQQSPSLFWNDVTSRAKALSNPSSFQRPRAHHY